MPALNHIRDSSANTIVIGYCVNITDVKTLGERLTFARELRGLSQQELAEKSGCSQGAIGNVESGERHSLRNLVLVARRLRVSADWLYDGTGPTPVPGVSEPTVAYYQSSAIWPFTSVRPGDLEALPRASLAEIEDFMRFKLSQVASSHEAASATGTAGAPKRRGH